MSAQPQEISRVVALALASARQRAGVEKAASAPVVPLAEHSTKVADALEALARTAVASDPYRTAILDDFLKQADQAQAPVSASTVRGTQSEIPTPKGSTTVLGKAPASGKQPEVTKTDDGKSEDGKKVESPKAATLWDTLHGKQADQAQAKVTKSEQEDPPAPTAEGGNVPQALATKEKAVAAQNRELAAPIQAKLTQIFNAKHVRDTGPSQATARAVAPAAAVQTLKNAEKELHVADEKNVGSRVATGAAIGGLAGLAGGVPSGMRGALGGALAGYTYHRGTRAGHREESRDPGQSMLTPANVVGTLFSPAAGIAHMVGRNQGIVAAKDERETSKKSSFPALLTRGLETAQGARGAMAKQAQADLVRRLLR